MTLEGVKAFLSACEAAGIKEYQFDTDLGTHFYHNTENSIIALDESKEIAYNFRTKINNINTSYDGRLYVQGAHLSDVHEVRFGGTYETIKKFIDAYGLTIPTEQLQILIKNDRSNYNLNPATGDYQFVKLTEEELNELSDEEKASYEAELKLRESFKQGIVARVE